MSQIIVQGRCVPNKHAVNVRFIWESFIKIYPGLLHLGCCNILVAISALFTLFLLSASGTIQKGAGFNLINVQVLTIVSFKLINVQAQIRPCRVT